MQIGIRVGVLLALQLSHHLVDHRLLLGKIGVGARPLRFDQCLLGLSNCGPRLAHVLVGWAIVQHVELRLIANEFLLRGFKRALQLRELRRLRPIDDGVELRLVRLQLLLGRDERALRTSLLRLECPILERIELGLIGQEFLG